jgi:hypothetical protein
MSITEATRSEVEHRAQHRCEYCRKRFLAERAEVEHIIPRARGGTDSLANLALACARCNSNKSTAADVIDPLYRTTEELFHPRRDCWTEHFKITTDGPVGTSARGRATAALLFQNKRSDYPHDLEWHWIVPLRERSMSLYLEINRLRFWRLSNRFSSLESTLKNLDPTSVHDPELIRRTHVALSLLQLETYFMRSRPADVLAALRLSRHALRNLSLLPAERAEVFLVQSIVYQQLATAYRIAGNRGKARTLQARAVRMHNASLAGQPRVEFRARLRHESQKARVDPTAAVRLRKEDVYLAANVAGMGEFRALVYAADLELFSRSNKLLELILEHVTIALESSGYGQGPDHAKGIALRRRWWALRYAVHERIDLSLLAEDIKLWKSLHMQNELRELLQLFMLVADQTGRRLSPDLLSLLVQDTKYPAAR